ncbi:MAG TPA: rubredoxin [Leptolyngbyaceae cyanobacterium M33_DOE_097]|uniref:Rubredoxin n=1 Tax=Oscillatoriales cyanobacterium SpSt-418 TaxID=2282169 RepID=A0A7C3KC08_9CYAN|nr:rubredoxin [Leptolyngbyaceae cyanobacterium M33_DOE_097]
MTTPDTVGQNSENGADQVNPSVEVVDAVVDPKTLDRYECGTCGYIYEPAKGDDRSQIAAGTPFEELPQGWKCPVCNAPQNRFQNIGAVGAPSGFKENLKYGLGVNTLTPGQKNLLIFGGLALAFLFFLSLYGLQ